jgi:putative ABC transport system ATP-binding protein
MISVRKVAKSFGGRVLWKDVSLEVGRGELVALVGPSGCGKSTLLNCIGLLEKVDSGQIFVDDREVTKFGAGDKRRFRRDTLGYLFQNYALIDNATITFNLQVAVSAQLTRPRRREVFEQALEEVGLGGRGDEPVYRLSGGEQQRVALARLMVKKPTVVLADEPTGALDQANSDVVMNILHKMAAGGCAVLIATHSRRVMDSCDKALPVGD